MKNYFRHAGRDVPASLVVFLIAVPLCLGIALGSNAPVLSGIIAGVVGGIVVGILSKSHLSVTGPAAGLTTTVVVILGKLPAFEAFLLCVVIAGLFQIIFGFLKAGLIVDFVPVSVLKGMLAAIGLLLIFKQFPHLVGYDADFEGDQSFLQKDGHNTFTEVEYALQNLTPIAMLIGFLGLAIQWFWDSKYFPLKQWKRNFPAPLMVVVVGVIVNKMAGHGNGVPPEHMVNLPTTDSITQIGSILRFPDIQYLSHPQVWIGAIEIAIIASLESLLSVQAIDKLDPQKQTTPLNRELLAQGVGNTVSGLLGGLPVTSVIVRGSANVNAGAQTSLSAILHGFILMLCLLFFPELLNQIPLCALASILIYTGFKLAHPKIIKEQWKKGKMVLYPFVITILAILLTDLLIGIGIGLLLGVYFVIRSNFKDAIRIAHDGRHYLLKFNQQVTFLNKILLKERLDGIPHGASVTIDLTRSNFIDNDILEMLADYKVLAQHNRIHFEIRYLNEAQQAKFNI